MAGVERDDVGDDRRCVAFETLHLKEAESASQKAYKSV